MRAFKIAIIILGRPGSGKDTQAELLAKKFGLVHIISSKIIKKTLVSKQKEIKLDGKIYSVQKERENLHNGRLTTFTFVSALVSNEIRIIFNVWISPKEVYIRNLKRHRKDLPELDTKKVIDKRLKMFNKYTLPVIKLLEKQKKIIEINGEQSIMKIHLDIIKVLLPKIK